MNRRTFFQISISLRSTPLKWLLLIGISLPLLAIGCSKIFVNVVTSQGGGFYGYNCPMAFVQNKSGLSYGPSGQVPYGMTFSATNLPVGLSINPTTGIISGTPTSTTNGPNNFFINITGGNQYGGMGNQNVTIEVAPIGYIVNDFTSDANQLTVGTQTCTSTNGTCTLRAAIQELNYDLPHFVYNNGLVILPQGQTMIISPPTSISTNIDFYGTCGSGGGGAGNNGGSIVDGSQGFQVFTISGGNVGFYNLTIQNGQTVVAGAGISAIGALSVNLQSVTVQNNRLTGAVTDNGAGLYVTNGPSQSIVNVWNSLFQSNQSVGTAGSGGAIYVVTNNASTPAVNISNSEFISNQAASAGAISMSGQGNLQVSNSYFGNNSATTPGGYGGAIGLTGTAGPPLYQIWNNTFYQNAVTTGAGLGGAIYLGSSGLLYLYNNTISQSQVQMASGFGGALYVGGGESAFYVNNIFNQNTVAGVVSTCAAAGVLTSLGNNIYEDTSCNPAGDFAGSALLNPPTNNFWQTPMMVPQTGSLAIGNGSMVSCMSFPVNGTDQNHDPRGLNNRCNIGAYEAPPNYQSGH